MQKCSSFNTYQFPGWMITKRERSNSTQPLPLSISVSPQLVKQREGRVEGFIAIRVIARENTSGLIAGCPLPSLRAPSVASVRPSVHIRPFKEFLPRQFCTAAMKEDRQRRNEFETSKSPKMVVLRRRESAVSAIIRFNLKLVA